VPIVELGEPYTTTLLIRDEDGRPVTSGVTGYLSLRGPASGTPIAAPTLMAHEGSGAWGVTWAGDNFPATGVYTYSAPIVTSGSTVLYEQGGWFWAGLLPPGALTVWELLEALCLPLEDGWAGEATGDGTVGGGSGTLVDARLATPDGVAGDWRGAEVLLRQPGYPPTVRSLPHRVTGFDPDTGALTLAPAPPAAIAAGTGYLLCDQGGARRLTVGRRLLALRAALRLGGATRRASDGVALTIADAQDEYAIPDHLATVSRVSIGHDGDQGDRWWPLPPDEWPRLVRADRRLLTLRGYSAGSRVLLSGAARQALPDFLDAYVDGPSDWYVTRAAADLLKSSPIAAHQRMAGPLWQEAIVTRPRRTPDASEIRLG
jgi:hypothetical protein